MDEPRRISASVVIVGGGPVGLALAVALGKAGISCVLVERRPEPSPIPWFPIGGITAYQSLARRVLVRPDPPADAAAVLRRAIGA